MNERRREMKGGGGELCDRMELRTFDKSIFIHHHNNDNSKKGTKVLILLLDCQHFKDPIHYLATQEEKNSSPSEMSITLSQLQKTNY